MHSNNGLARSFGVRARTAAIAAVAAALALVLGGAVMLLMLHQSNNRSMYATASARTEQIARTIEADGVGALGTADLAPGKGVDFTQVVDQSGNVAAASAGAPTTPIVDGSTPEGTYRYRSDVTVPGHPGKFCASTLSAEHDEQYFTVIAVVAAGGLRRSELTTAAILAIELPVIVAFSACAAYWLVGRALAPVSRIITQANEITGTALERRVPVPAAHDELRTLATSMNSMLARLENSHDAQMRFVGDASHELRSPLTTVVGLLDLADDTDSPLDLPTVRTILLPEARRMQTMVDDLLLLARADEDGLPLRVKEIDLDDVVGDEAVRVRALGVARVRMRVIPTRILGDPTMIGRALRNLTDNAVRHASSTVWLSMHRDADSAVVTVSDDGPGIAADQAERVFERFARLDTDRRAVSTGTGLGLAIVREIAIAHGGRVRCVESEHGGASVALYLPVADDGSPDLLSDTRRARPVLLRKRGERALVVDSPDDDLDRIRR